MDRSGLLKLAVTASAENRTISNGKMNHSFYNCYGTFVCNKTYS